MGKGLTRFRWINPFYLPGRDDWIWTSGPLNPIQVRYQTALRPDEITSTIINKTCQVSIIFPIIFSIDVIKIKHRPKIFEIFLLRVTGLRAGRELWFLEGEFRFLNPQRESNPLPTIRAGLPGSLKLFPAIRTFHTYLLNIFFREFTFGKKTAGDKLSKSANSKHFFSLFA